MPRIRTVKPELAKHEGLFDAEEETGLPIRYVWALLPCFCDREGRFEWRERRLTAEILPYDNKADMSRVLDALLTRGFLVKYRAGRAWYGWIPTFGTHQVINNRESKSEIPGPSDADEVIYEGDHDLNLPSSTRRPRVNDASATREVHAQGERKGREGKGDRDADASLSTPDGEDGDGDQLKLDGEPKQAGPPPCNHRGVIELYNELLPELRTALIDRWPGSQGETWLRARWREQPAHQDLDWWREFFRVVRTNPHWMGENNRGWKADLRWLLKRENFDKVVERWASLGEAA